MIPNDGSALSAKLRDQSDEQIVIRLRDGPLQTIKANWKAMDLEPEAMAERRSKAKQNAWLDRKVLIRERYRDELSGLQGPEHDYLFNKGFVSPEVSDGEGGRIVEQPEYRVRWVNNLIDAIDMASAQASKARPGHRDPPPRKHIVVKCEVPNLLACTGSKGAIRIAACALSRKWRKANQSVVSQSPRINPLLKDPPNIDCFLEKYPTSTPEDAYDENPLPTADDLENDGGDEGDGGIGWGDSGIGLSRGEDEDWAEPGTQEGVVKEGGGNMGEVVGEEGEQDAWDALDVGEGATSMGIGEDGNQNFPLDPVLGGKSSHTMPAPHTTTPIEPANHTVADADPVAPTGQGPHTNSVAPTAPAGTPAPVSIYVPPDSCPHHPPMRSPPLLPASVSEPAPQDPAAMQASTSKLAKKKKAVAEPKLDVNGQPIKPRRGRPPGSKNKPKGDKVVN
ncbi:hypothetical protein FRC06_007686 [Ceratobasidium sp. 370]|nr:hypothetical protein FRC06_007686 [Ceratobasidium sp. 370]